MTAALLERTERATGAYLSPHAALERADPDRRRRDRAGGARRRRRAGRDAVPAVERDLPEGDVVTQFEAAIAASFVAFAAAGVEVAVIEAGLGGRLDATNVIPSRVTALTSVGLDHTEWLGETELEIAAEKLAVLREGTALVVGAVARRSRIWLAGRPRSATPPWSMPRSLYPRPRCRAAPYLARNLAVAVAAAEQIAARSTGA